MNRIRATLFGDFTIQIGEETHTRFRTIKVQALLAYLFLNNETPSRRKQLFDLLWPGMPQKSAQVNLRQTLYQARKVLSSAIDAPILSGKGQVWLNPELPLSADIWHFDNLLNDIAKHDHFDLHSCQPCHEQLKQATALYSGPLLTNVYLADSNVFEEWAVGWRTAYERRYVDALSTLTAIHLRNGEYVAAEASARQQIAYDNLREIAYRQLMQALARNQQREAALTVYEQCRSQLHIELGMSPTLRTMQLAERIAAGDSDLAAAHTPHVRGYDLLDQLGSGAFGTVHRARQPLIDREVAIKIIKPEYANRPNFIRQFEVEAQTIARLEHPYIVPLYDYWREPDGAFLVMRYMRGGNLEAALQNQGAWEAGAVLRLVDQLSAALATAHDHGVVHRDLNPSNILLDEAGNAYLSDFGIARHIVEQDDTTSLPKAATLTRSPFYISPEQLRGQQVTARSDIYTFGLLLFELLAGCKPFGTASPGQVLQQHLHGSVPAIQSFSPTVPDPVNDILQRATAKDPADRFGDVRDLADQLHDAFANTTTYVQPTPTARVEGNPYKGLQAFQEVDAETFFGRSELTNQLTKTLIETRFVTVVGPSGSGKSSVVKAGLLPALRSGAIDGSDQWFVTEMVPGTHPLEELEAALMRVAIDPPASLIEPLQRDERGLGRVLKRILPEPTDQSGNAATLLLVIDQFEELFTLVDEPARHSFLNNVLTALREPRCQLRVVATLRADFYDRPLELTELADYIKAHSIVVTPLTGAELEETIVRPAALAGARLEDGLVAQIIDDVHDQPGMLPLLQYALTELYERRQNNVMTHAAYREMGGVQGVLGTRAEALYRSLSETDQALAHQFFLRLVTLGEGSEDTRRRVLQSELESISDDDAPHTSTFLLQPFGTARLLSFDFDTATRTPTVEVAHEALLREWSRLRSWLEESRADVRLQRLLAAATAEWLTADRDPSYLLRGSRLELFEGWRDTTVIALTQDESAFLAASNHTRRLRLSEEEARRQREVEIAQELAHERQQRAEERATEQELAANSLRKRAYLLVGALAIALLFALTSLIFGRSAIRTADIAATSEALAIEEAVARSTAEADALHAKATSDANALLAANSEIIAVEQAEIAQDNANLAATREAEAIAASGVALEAQQEAETQLNLARSRELALATINNLDEDAELGVLLALEALKTAHTREAVDAMHQALLASNIAFRPAAHDLPMAEIAWSPDGTMIGGSSWRLTDDDSIGVAFIWDAVTGQEIARWDGLGSDASRIAFSPDSSSVALSLGNSSTGGDVVIFDVTGGELIQSFSVFQENIHSDVKVEELWQWPGTVSVSFSPDGRRLATSQFDMETLSATVWDRDTGSALFSLPGFGTTDGGTLSWQDGPNFSPDGQFLTGAARNGTAMVWDAASGEPLLTVSVDDDAVIVESIIAPGSTMFYTKSSNGLISAWDLETGDLLWEQDTLSTWYGIDLSRDGRWLAVGTVEGDVHILDAQSGLFQRVLVGGDTNGIGDVAFNPDATAIVGKGEDGTILVWNLLPSAEVSNLVHEGLASTVAYDAGGRLMATAAIANAEKVWDILSASTAPTAASKNGQGVIKLWDAASGELLHQLDAHTGWIGGLAFSADGSYLASSSDDQTAKVWDTHSGELLVTLEGHDDWVNRVAFSPDGTQLATTSQDETLRIWDRTTGALLRIITVANDATNPMWGLAWSPDGMQIAAAVDAFVPRQTGIRVWDVQTGELLMILSDTARAAGQIYYTDDGYSLVSYDVGGTVQVWDADSGERTQSFEIGRRILGMDLHPDQDLVVVGTFDGTVEVWDLGSSEQIVTLLDTEDSFQNPVFTPDGKRVATAGYSDGIVRILTLDYDELVGLAQSRLTRQLTPSECLQYRVEPCPAE